MVMHCIPNIDNTVGEDVSITSSITVWLS